MALAEGRAAVGVRRGSSTWWHAEKPTTWMFLVIFGLQLVFERAVCTIFITVTEESTALRVHSVMAFVADTDTDGAHSRIPCQATRIAMIVVLIFEVFTSTQESALLFGTEHVTGIVCLTVIEHFLLVSFESGLFFLFLVITAHSLTPFIFARAREHRH